MNLCNLRRTLELRPIRNWDTLYVLIDVHGVIIPGSWHKYNDFRFISEDCIEVLQWFTKRKDFKLILWTSSHDDEIVAIIEWLNKFNIDINFVNRNPECKNTEYANFSNKPYFNILIDDKASFDPTIDWLLLGKEIENCTGDSVFKWTPDKKQRLIDGVERLKGELHNFIIFK